MAKSTVSLSNDVRFELITNRGEFVGIGKVWAGRALLRSGSRPMFVEIRTPDGVQMVSYHTVREDVTPDGVVLEFAMRAKAGGLMEYMLHEVRNRYNTADWSQPPQELPNTRLRLEIRPVDRVIGRYSFTGFSYQYSYRSDEHPIYKILDRGTWEIGGKAVGNEFWMRSLAAPPICEIESVQQHYSIEWYLPSCLNPNIFQFYPLQTELQGFTFTTSPRGALVTFPTEIGHVRSLFEKPRGCNEIVHWHEHCGDLAHEFVTSPVEVLWLAGRQDRIGRFNLYDAVREMVYESLHRQIGMKREYVEPYGQIEEWSLPDMDSYTDEGVPALTACGAKVIGLANHFQNNMNTWGVSNMCCTVDYQVAETVGREKLKRLCDKAKAGGAKVEMWANTSISTLTIIFDNRNDRTDRIRFLPREGSIMEALDKAEAPFVRNPSGAIEADHYTPVFAVLNLRDPVVRDYWLKRWKEAHDEIGLEGIFLDSSFNLSSDKFHWQQNAAFGKHAGATADQTHLLGNVRPEKPLPAEVLSQYKAHLALMAEMQKIGYKYCNEDIGVFGVHRHGPDMARHLNTLPMWVECYTNFDPPGIREAGLDPDDVFFRGLAYRIMWMLRWDTNSKVLTWKYGNSQDEAYAPTEWQLSLYRAFGEVNGLMRNREILPKEKGVMYRPEGKRVLWAFQDFPLPLEGTTAVRDVLAGETVQADKMLAAKRHRIYVIG